MTDVIPQLELIIGSQPEVLSLELQENSNRFYAVFQSFIRVFGTLNHPLVLFLDDLQWADPASLQMIKNLMTDNSIRYIYIILSHRTNNISFNNPFFDMLDALKKEKLYPHTIRLNELKQNDISQLLIDCFFSNEDNVKYLSELIFAKTGGNPFFIIELLKDLSRNKLIYPDKENGKWNWDLEEIKNTKISENIIELLILKIKRLPSQLQEILKVSASIGSSFDLWLLMNIRKDTYQDTIDSLKELIREDFIILPDRSMQKLNQSPIEDLKPEEAKQIVYQFQHDRVQQAAFDLS
jgi:predicted ATPase